MAYTGAEHQGELGWAGSGARHMPVHPVAAGEEPCPPTEAEGAGRLGQEGVRDQERYRSRDTAAGLRIVRAVDQGAAQSCLVIPLAGSQSLRKQQRLAGCEVRWENRKQTLPAPGHHTCFVDGRPEAAAGCRVEKGLRGAASKECSAEQEGMC